MLRAGSGALFFVGACSAEVPWDSLWQRHLDTGAPLARAWSGDGGSACRFSLCSFGRACRPCPPDLHCGTRSMQQSALWSSASSGHTCLLAAWQLCDGLHLAGGHGAELRLLHVQPPQVAPRRSSTLGRQQRRTCQALVGARRPVPNPAAHDGLGGPKAGPHAQHPAHPADEGRQCGCHIAHGLTIQLRT